MVIVLQLTVEAAAVALEDPDDMRRFHVRVEGAVDHERIAAAFRATGLGGFESTERALVNVASVRELASGRSGPDWEKRFQEMLAYAAGKGWYDEAAGTIQAHTEVASEA